MTPDQYRSLYLAPIRPPAGAPRPVVTLPPHHFYVPLGAERPLPTLHELYEAGVLCGHGESRAQIGQRTRQVDADLAFLGGQLRQRELDLADFARAHDDHVRHLEHAVTHAREVVLGYQNSTFWRLTFPLRWLTHRAKLAVRSVRGARHFVSLIPARLSVARQILKDEGAVQLLQRVAQKLFGVARTSFSPARDYRVETAIHALAFPAVAAPEITIVIPVYGQHLHTFTCLKSLLAEAASVSFEVVVMDDCAPDAAAAALAPVTGIRIERNSANLGFIGNCNRGAALARGKYLLFLNNDTLVLPGALTAMLETFRLRKDAGAVGAKLLFADGKLQEAGGIVWRDASAWNYGRGDDPGRPEYNYLRESDYCSGAALLVPTELFRKLGGFDARYAPAYCEDADFCFRVREAGLKVYYQPHAVIVHFEGVSHGTSEAEGVKRYQAVNREKFYERWRNVLAAHRVNGVLPALERDRTAERRVLVVEACMLTPDQDSGSVRTSRVLEVMVAMGCKVSFVAHNLQHLEPYVGALQAAGIEVLHYPYVTSVEALIEERGREFDVIVLARYYIAGGLIDAVRRHAPQALIVLDTHDLHFLRTRRLATLENSKALAQSAASIYQKEVDCIRRVDVTWVVSPVEKEVLAQEVPQARVIVQTNIHDPLDSIPPYEEREGLLFVGGFRHPPNVDAILFYAREIAPLLRERLPGVKTYVVGSNAPQAVLALASGDIEVVGFVPEVEPWLARCRLSVSPLRYGAGVKGKINQAMAHGVPVVATAPSVEGMQLVAGEEVLVADDPRAFADAVALAYADREAWLRLSRAGTENVRRYFSREVAREAIGATFAHARRP
jgi:GT2 family glycosyltransferase